MAKKIILLFVVLTVALVAVSSVAAITNGQPDGDGHPYVGVISNQDQSQFCSGFAVAPNVLVTAGHCFEDGEIVLVTFDTSPADAGPQDLYAGIFYRHPAYCSDCAPGVHGAFENDLAVVWWLQNLVTGQPADLDRYAQLPAQRATGALANKTGVTLVGYGFQDFIRGGGPPLPTFDQTRHVAQAQLLTGQKAQSDQYVKLSASQGNDNGGFCFGDSGGPVLLAGTDTALALNSYATNARCAGVTYSSRVDTQSALGFIGYFLP
jgi:secreted trypsin-like serine protease